MAFLTNNIRTLVIPATILTAGAPADIGSIRIPIDISRYALIGAYAYAITAAGTLAAATLDVRTGASGAGNSLLAAPIALSGLTAANLVQSLVPVALGPTEAGGTVYINQTVASLNAGTVNIVLQILQLA